MEGRGAEGKSEERSKSAVPPEEGRPRPKFGPWLLTARVWQPRPVRSPGRVRSDASGGRGAGRSSPDLPSSSPSKSSPSARTSTPGSPPDSDGWQKPAKVARRRSPGQDTGDLSGDGSVFPPGFGPLAALGDKMELGNLEGPSDLLMIEYGAGALKRGRSPPSHSSASPICSTPDSSKDEVRSSTSLSSASFKVRQAISLSPPSMKVSDSSPCMAGPHGSSLPASLSSISGAVGAEALGNSVSGKDSVKGVRGEGELKGASSVSASGVRPGKGLGKAARPVAFSSGREGGQQVGGAAKGKGILSLGAGGFREAVGRVDPSSGDSGVVLLTGCRDEGARGGSLASQEGTGGQEGVREGNRRILVGGLSVLIGSRDQPNSSSGMDRVRGILPVTVGQDLLAPQHDEVGNLKVALFQGQRGLE